MGNEVGKPTCPLGIAAMAATTTNIEINELTELFKKCLKLAQASAHPESLTRSDLDTAIKGIENFQPSDTELLDKMFTMYDNTGEGAVDIREYSVAASTLITGIDMNLDFLIYSHVHSYLLMRFVGTVVEKLRFAFKLFDIDNVGSVTRGELKKVLHSINNVASYFGDSVVTPEDIDCIVLDVFEKASVSSVVIENSISKISSHEIALKFINAQGSVRFGR